jgi:hypothetical protein
VKFDLAVPVKDMLTLLQWAIEQGKAKAAAAQESAPATVAPTTVAPSTVVPE